MDHRQLTPHDADVEASGRACRRYGAVMHLLVATLILSSCGHRSDPSTDAQPLPRSRFIDVVHSFNIQLDDPDVGQLRFEGLAAGRPEAAADGRLVIFLHGFPASAEGFRDAMQIIADAGYFVIAPNQRGYSAGARPNGVGSYGILELVDDVVGIASALGADRFHLAGHDWGGAVAWVTAGLHPDRVASLTVLSTPHPDALDDGIADLGSDQHRMSGYMTDLRAPGSEHRLLHHGFAAFVSRFATGPPPDDYVAAYARILGNPSALGAAISWYRATPSPSPARLGPVDVPVSYLWGTEDAVFSAEAAEATADHVSGPYTFTQLDGLDHWLPERAPDAVAAALLDNVATEGHDDGPS